MQMRNMKETLPDLKLWGESLHIFDSYFRRRDYSLLDRCSSYTAGECFAAEPLGKPVAYIYIFN